MHGKHSYYVYIMTNPSHTMLYVGVTNNLKRRVHEHKHKLVEGLTTAGNFIIIYFSHETLGLGSSAGDQLYHCLAVVSSSLSLPANCLLGQS